MLTFNLNKYELNNNGIMLDVGCGEGRHIFGIMQDYPQMKCIGLDISFGVNDVYNIHAIYESYDDNDASAPYVILEY